MSLTIKTKLVTDKQLTLLHKLAYYGSLELTSTEAAALIDELYEQQRLNRLEDKREMDNIFETYYDNKFFF